MRGCVARLLYALRGLCKRMAQEKPYWDGYTCIRGVTPLGAAAARTAARIDCLLERLYARD